MEPEMPSTTINVSTAAQLAAAIKSVKGGETILLAPGDYGSVNINARKLGSTVTIKSADSANDAVFTNLRVSNSTGWAFSDIDVYRPLKAGEPNFTTAAYVSGSSRIDFIGVDFHGSMDKNSWNDGWGLRVSYSDSVRVVDSTFEQLKIGAVFDHDTGLTLVGNSVTDVREGFDFSAVHGVAIARNLFTAFTPDNTLGMALGDHSDAIQFWNNGVKEGSSDIVISDNVMLQGTNDTHGIFFRAQDPTPAYRFSNVVIENNLYQGDARHGITLSGTDGGIIRGNTVVSASGGTLEAGINIGDTTKVTVDHNITPLLLTTGTNTGLTVTDNIDLWDSVQKKGVTLASIFATTPAGLNIDSYALKAGSAAATLHAGFANTDGIGAASFDLARASSYAHLDLHGATLPSIV
jgi:parallel beta-helix repeat protein